MSLTRHLKDPDSPIREFIHLCAPDLAVAGARGTAGKDMASGFRFDELTSLDTEIPIPPDVKPARRSAHAVTAGIALDYRVRMDLPGFDIGETAAWKGLKRLQASPNVVHRGRHIANLLQDSLSFAFFTLEKKDPHPLSLAEVSLPLAWCEAIYRAGPVTALTGDLGRQIKRAKDWGDLLLNLDESLVIDIARMHAPMTQVLMDWSQEIAEGLAYEPNPAFLGSAAVGGADGDLIVGDLLIDIKTREEITNPWLRGVLFQLLGYTLLDLDDTHAIRRVGILLPRQVHFEVWSVDELIGHNADEALPVLRNEFASLLAGMLPDSFSETPSGEDDENEDEIAAQPV